MRLPPACCQISYYQEGVLLFKTIKLSSIVLLSFPLPPLLSNVRLGQNTKSIVDIESLWNQKPFQSTCFKAGISIGFALKTVRPGHLRRAMAFLPLPFLPFLPRAAYGVLPFRLWRAAISTNRNHLTFGSRLK